MSNNRVISIFVAEGTRGPSLYENIGEGYVVQKILSSKPEKRKDVEGVLLEVNAIQSVELKKVIYG